MTTQITGAVNLEECCQVEFKEAHYALLPYSKGCMAWRQEGKYFKPAVLFFPIFQKRNLFLQEGQFCNHESFIQYKQFVSSIPEELRNLVLPLGKYQWLGLEALYHVDGFEDFLKQEGKNKSYNYIAAVWTLAMASRQPFNKRLALVRDIMYEQRSLLLTSLLDLPCKKCLLRLLNQFSIEDLDIEFISILYHFSTEKKLYTALQQNPGAGKILLSKIYYELPDWLITPESIKALNGLPDYINSLRAVFPPAVRDAQGTERQQILASLKSVSNYESLEMKLAELSQKFLLAGKFPAPPFEGSRKLTPIKTGALLKKEGLKMHNCVAGYAKEIIDGESYFYHWSEEDGEEATVQLIREDDNQWYFEEALGIANQELKHATILKIKNELARLMPEKALSILSCALAGTYYYKAASLWKSIDENSHIILQREPENPYDSLAVAVFLLRNGQLFQLGYIPRIYNSEIAGYMDEGQDLIAKILYKKEQKAYKNIIIKVSLPALEEGGEENKI